ncbi:MAG: ribbon-helix-helix domain-containing protein [Robiginitomaculum sp.]|nr:ribbon-helix-helix domain-containing protein [Robiginitomaculum sp.]
MLEKKSLALSGHRTSLALEAVFWAALGNIAREENKSLARLIAEIDQTRSKSEVRSGLASAVRVWLFMRYADVAA